MGIGDLRMLFHWNNFFVLLEKYPVGIGDGGGLFFLMLSDQLLEKYPVGIGDRTFL